ncbi:MAG: flagellar biosynthesis protein FlhA, partial [Sphingobium sp. 32-64-5]
MTRTQVNGKVWMSTAKGAILPLATLLLVMFMLVPVPAILLDIGFIGNITISLAVLMVALNAARPLDFSSFPTVLLFATLMRLGLNVASTRVVLVDGHNGPDAAGHVIESFGNFLIGGDYVVGLFVFAILMIINLVVITKGAGRVSEVSARFTLDAMPGKQMAIDAGVLILLINIIGGIILGTVSHGLTLADAAQTYIVLAIGDALVAQVPALVLSIAAASIVTRVNSEHDLGGQIANQFGSGKAWTPVAAILGILGVIPGMPHMIILPVAALCGYVAWRLRQAQKAQAEAAAAPPPAEPENPAKIDWADVSDGAVLGLEVGYGLIPLVDDRKGAPLMARITGIRKQLSRELGFVVPLVRVKDNLSLEPHGYRITIGGVIVGEDEVWP